MPKRSLYQRLTTQKPRCIIEVFYYFRLMIINGVRGRVRKNGVTFRTNMTVHLKQLKNAFDQVLLYDDIHALWSGCGSIIKANIDGQDVVIKHTYVPDSLKHRHIIQTDIAKHRKAKSYAVEMDFYQFITAALPAHIDVPELIWSASSDFSNTLVFKDFSFSDFVTPEIASLADIKEIITWLARFHGTFLGVSSPLIEQKLWSQGGYWHLATRPDEYRKMADCPEKIHAAQMDTIITNSPFKTLIHGDAKLANFALNQQMVIGYDFQYVGKGIGLQDVMLFFTSVFNAEQLTEHCDMLLEFYFEALQLALSNRFEPRVIQQIEQSWREAWPIIWADFYRFLLGWKPDHSKINPYMKMQSKMAVAQMVL